MRAIRRSAGRCPLPTPALEKSYPQNPQTYSEALAMDRSAREILQKLVDATPDNVDLAHLLAFADWGIAGVSLDMGDLEGVAQPGNAALRMLKKLSADDPRVAE